MFERFINRYDNKNFGDNLINYNQLQLVIIFQKKTSYNLL